MISFMPDRLRAPPVFKIPPFGSSLFLPQPVSDRTDLVVFAHVIKVLSAIDLLLVLEIAIRARTFDFMPAVAAFQYGGRRF